MAKNRVFQVEVITLHPVMRAWPFIHRQAEGRTALVSGDSVNKRAFREENIADLFSGQMIAIQLYLKKNVFIVVLQLGKETYSDILKDQHPNFNQNASNDVLVSLNENTCGGCTTFKISISILFIAFDDMKSSPFEDEIQLVVKYLNWQPEMLLMFAPVKTTRLFTSDAPLGPRSWFRLACATER